MAHDQEPSTITITRAQQRFFSWMTDVLVYVVVLNLFVEHLDDVVIDSFTISIFTAVLLKLMLDVILGFEHNVNEFWAQREGAVYRVLGTVSMFAILFFSKFLILEVVDLVFGDHVDLGHLIEVIALVIALILAQRLFRYIFDRLGERDAEVTAGASD